MLGAAGFPRACVLLFILNSLLNRSVEAGAKTRSSTRSGVHEKRPGPKKMQNRVPYDGFKRSPRPIPSNQRIPNLLCWLKQQGVDHRSIDLKDGKSDGVGLYATTNLKCGDEIFQIPSRLIIRPEVPGLRCSSLSTYGALALRLLWEVHCGDASPFAGYLTTLPARHSLHLPLLWEEREIKLLAGHGETSLRQWQEAVEEEGRRAMALAKQLGSEGAEGSVGGFSFSMESWVWAWAVAMSRSSCLDRGDESSLAIVPLLDLSNHEDDCLNPIIWADPAGSVHFLASRGYEAGEQVTNSYGPLTAANKLYTFGYLDELMGPSGHSQGLPRKGSSFLSFSFLKDEKDDTIRDMRTRALQAAGMCVAEEFEIRVRLCTRSPEQADKGNAQTDAHPATGQGSEGAVLEPVIENMEEIDRMLTFLRLSLVDPTWLEGEAPDVCGVVRLLKRAHDKPPPEKELEAQVWAQARKVCRCRARTTMRRLEECWRRQARVGLPHLIPLHHRRYGNPSATTQRAYAQSARDTQPSASAHEWRYRSARDAPEEQPCGGHPFEPRERRPPRHEAPLQEEEAGGGKRLAWGRHVEGNRARPRYRHGEGASQHGEDRTARDQEGLGEHGHEARGYQHDGANSQGPHANLQGSRVPDVDAQSATSVEAERLRLTELWLQGERLALQALYTHFGGEGEVTA